MERGICPIAVHYFAINVFSTLKTVVGQQEYTFYYSVIFSKFWVT